MMRVGERGVNCGGGQTGITAGADGVKKKGTCNTTTTTAMI